MPYPLVHTILRRLSPNRSIRLTAEGTRFLLFTLAVGIAAVNTGNNLFYLLLAMMLSLIVMSGLLSEQCLRRMEFRRHVPEFLFANEPTTVTLSIANRKSRFPSFSLRIFDVVAGVDLDRGIHLQHLPPHSSVLVSYPLLVRRRGRYRLEGVRVATPFPFGLFQKTRHYPFDTTILVCPEPFPLSSTLLQDLSTIGQDQGLTRRGQGISLYNLREYRPGDDSRAIHWMTTARTSKLMIKETEAEDQRWVTIAVSPIAPLEQDAAFERALSVAASLVHAFLERGYQIALVVGAEEIPFGNGEQHYLRMLQTLALSERRNPEEMDALQARMTQALSQPKEGSTILISPWSHPAQINPVIGVDQIISPATYEALFHGTGSGLPT